MQVIISYIYTVYLIVNTAITFSASDYINIQGGPKKRPITIKLITALVIDIFA